MPRGTFRSDQLAWVFGTVSGTFAGGIGLFLMHHTGLQQRIDAFLPETPLGIGVSAWILLLSLILGCLVFPAVTILLARRRTFGWPLLPLVIYFLGLFWGHPISWKSVSSDQGPMCFGLLIFALIAWVPFSRTALFSGNVRLTDDKSCGPRALYLVCQALGLSVTLLQVRRLIKLSPRGSTLTQVGQAAEALTLTATRLPKGQMSLGASAAPAVGFIRWGRGRPNHAIAVLEIFGDRALIHDPNRPWQNIIPLQRLREALFDDLLCLSLPNAAPEMSAEAQADVWPPVPRLAHTAERSQNS